MTNTRILVVGASGFVGNAVLHAFAANTNNHIIGLSRRQPKQLPDNAEFFSLDLLDSDACAAAALQLADVDYMVYAAVNETQGDLISSWSDPDHASRNGQMFKNLFEPLSKTAQSLKHIVLIHGTKAYGAHLPNNTVPMPMRESLPRPPHDDFYFHQEDYLWQKAKAASWRWSILRAPTIVGGGADSNLNSLLAIAVYASVCKASGHALHFPGSADCNGAMEFVDVELLANAAVWACTAPAADNQLFNVANGDVYCWPDLWPVIADCIGVAIGSAKPRSIAAYMRDNAHCWRKIVEQYQLNTPSNWYDYLGESCALADFVLNNCGRNILTSTVKIHQAGFSDCIDSYDSVRKWIKRWRELQLLPPR